MLWDGCGYRIYRDFRFYFVTGLGIDQIPEFFDMFKNKKYCMLIFLKNPQKIEPFGIDKSGFGAMSAWISVDNVDRIKANP